METKELRRMDLFDLGAYFESYILVQARFRPLLKHAACACAAKHMGRGKVRKLPSVAIAHNWRVQNYLMIHQYIVKGRGVSLR